MISVKNLKFNSINESIFNFVTNCIAKVQLLSFRSKNQFHCLYNTYRIILGKTYLLPFQRLNIVSQWTFITVLIFCFLLFVKGGNFREIWVGLIVERLRVLKWERLCCYLRPAGSSNESLIIRAKRFGRVSSE